PTNMLDVRAILWLENYLQTWQSTILVVSHDRNFLNAVVTDIIHLHSQRLDSYRGDYENFIKTKEDRLKNQQREYEAQLQYRQHIQVLLLQYNVYSLSLLIRNLKIGYFSQHHVDQLDLNVCSVELLLNRFPGRTEEEYRHQLGGYGITGELATRPVASLSGGQKSRVAFAQMTMPCPNFYILDEPTNHLDMETIEALAKALNKFRVSR
uniref:ATP-binding cassette sub-family F member 3-like n=1 Tax=Epinephelus lanceolatus TaxID=310571 RepID=UPI001446BE0A